MSKFKVGDRVRRIINDNSGKGWVIKVGDVCTVMDRVNGCLPGYITVLCNGKICPNNDPERFEPVREPQKIVVTTDGKTTTARLFSGKELVKSAEAKCSPSDEFIFETGAALALDRLLGQEKKAEPKKLFPLEDIKAGYLLKIRDDNGDEYFMTVVPNREDVLGCCNIEKPAYWPLEKFGSELRYSDSCVVGIWGCAYNDDLLKNNLNYRTLLWSRD